MADFELNLPFTSFYKRTALIQPSTGVVCFSLWDPPVIKLDGDEKRLKVSDLDKGRLDLIAYREYGDRAYFPAIQIVNKIDYAPRDVRAGLVLIIPKFSRIQEALQATRSNG